MEILNDFEYLETFDEEEFFKIAIKSFVFSGKIITKLE